MHTMVSEFHQVGPLVPDRAVRSPVDEQAGAGPVLELLAEVNQMLVARRWAPDVVRVQVIVTPLGSSSGVALFQAFVTHPVFSP